MKATTTLTSLVAAASLVGAIGIAYAQTGDATTTTPIPQAPNTAQNMPGTPDMSATPNQPMATQPDLAPQADRN